MGSFIKELPELPEGIMDDSLFVISEPEEPIPPDEEDVRAYKTTALDMKNFFKEGDLKSEFIKVQSGQDIALPPSAHEAKLLDYTTLHEELLSKDITFDLPTCTATVTTGGIYWYTSCIQVAEATVVDSDSLTLYYLGAPKCDRSSFNPTIAGDYLFNLSFSTILSLGEGGTISPVYTRVSFPLSPMVVKTRSFMMIKISDG